MTKVSIASKDTQDLSSIKNLFKFLTTSKASGFLQIFDGSVEYFIYLNCGRLFQATNDVAPQERIERNIHRLTHTNKILTEEIIRLTIKELETKTRDIFSLPIDYQLIICLYEKKYISQEEASQLTKRIGREVFESLLSSSGKFYSDFINNRYNNPQFYQSKLSSFVYQCQQRLKVWQSFNPYIWSSYQRPYFFSEASARLNLGLPENQTICRLMTGLSFRQLGALVNKDELLLAKILYPSIVNKTVVLGNPKPPFDRLPKIANNSNEQSKQISEDNSQEINEDKFNNTQTIDTVNFEQNKYKLVCIDSCFTIKEQINYFLDRNMFSIFLIDDPQTALEQLIALEPNLILLNINMPNLNGYEFCSVLKNNPKLQKIPLVIISNKRGLINQTKARLAGADNFITKPFNRSDLLMTIFKHIDLG